MIATALGRRTSLEELAARFPLSRRGINLKNLIACAGHLGLSARPLRAELSALARIDLPCVLHWDMNHFVVLTSVSSRALKIVDPLVGERAISMAEASNHFTGVALEFSAMDGFEQQTAPDNKPLKLSDVVGKVRGAPSAVLQVLAVSLALELFLIISPLLNQFVVDDVLTSHDTELLNVLLAGFLVVVAIQCLLSLSRSWILAVLGSSLALQWLTRVFSHLVRLPSAWFESRQLGDIASRFGEVYEVQRFLTHSAIEAALDGLIAIIALTLMLLYSPLLTVIVCGAVAVYLFVRWASFKPMRRARLEKIVHKSKEETHFLETIRTIVPLRLFSGEQERQAKWQNLLVEFLNRDIRETRWAMSVETLNRLIFSVENLLVFWAGAHLVLAQDKQASTLTIGMLFAFVSYKLQFTSRISAAIDKMIEFHLLGLRVQRLSDILATPTESDVTPLGTPSTMERLPASIELKSVSFRYGDGEPWVLHQVDLRVLPGETVAIVGGSGSGKTTLTKIILGLLTPSEGEVLYGGVPVRQLGVQNVRERFGVVMQEDSLISGSLLENIAFFDISPDLERAEECAKAAQLHADILRMSMGYQTIIGDLGHGLSGGQKQRLLLARALYKRPSVLILDEATSHLDLENEKAIVEAIGKLGLTLLLVAHRPETIRRAERAIRVVSGRVLDTSIDRQPVDEAPSPSKEKRASVPSTES